MLLFHGEIVSSMLGAASCVHIAIPPDGISGIGVTALAVIDILIQTHLSEERLADCCAFMALLYV